MALEKLFKEEERLKDHFDAIDIRTGKNATRSRANCAGGRQSDFDVTLTLIANSLYKILASKMLRFEKSKLKRVFRNFIDIPAIVTTGKMEVEV